MLFFGFHVSFFFHTQETICIATDKVWEKLGRNYFSPLSTDRTSQAPSPLCPLKKQLLHLGIQTTLHHSRPLFAEKKFSQTCLNICRQKHLSGRLHPPHVLEIPGLPTLQKVDNSLYILKWITKYSWPFPFPPLLFRHHPVNGSIFFAPGGIWDGIKGVAGIVAYEETSKKLLKT